MQAVDFTAIGRRVRKQREHDVERIEDDPLSAHLGRLCPKRGKHAAQVERPRLHKVGRRLGVYKENLLGHQVGQLPAESFGVPGDARGRFLECNENARLVALARAMHEVLQG